MNNEWSVGSLCEIYSNSIQEWFDGEIVQIIRGNSVRVKFGIYEKVLPINSSDLRPRKILYAPTIIQKQNSGVRLINIISRQLHSTNNTNTVQCTECNNYNIIDATYCHYCNVSLNECYHCANPNQVQAMQCVMCHHVLQSRPTRTSTAITHQQNQIQYTSFSWKPKLNHLMKAIKHELYDKIAYAFGKAIDFEGQDIDMILNKLRKKKNIKDNEIQYIKQIALRADTFRMGMETTDIESQHRISKNVKAIADNLDIDTLYDIYSVHNNFLFSNYQFAEYKADDFIWDIQSNVYFDKYKYNENFVSAIDSLKQYIPTINLYPQYIIEDDMYDICRYFFAGSQLLQQLLTKKPDTLAPFIMKIVIIPERVATVYEETIACPFNINDIGVFLQTKKLTSFKSSTISSFEAEDLLIITKHFESQLYLLETAFNNISNCTIIVDRRHQIQRIYAIALNKESDQLPELNQNYFMSLQFKVTRQNVVRCHLFYGLNKCEKM
eukprot:405076_1